MLNIQICSFQDHKKSNGRKHKSFTLFYSPISRIPLYKLFRRVSRMTRKVYPISWVKFSENQAESVLHRKTKQQEDPVASIFRGFAT